MNNKLKILTVISVLFCPFLSSQSVLAITITRKWTSEDKSTATIVVLNGETLGPLPLKGGGKSQPMTCSIKFPGNSPCILTIKDLALPPTVWKVYNGNTTVGGGVCG
jgi:hypothetical protein